MAEAGRRLRLATGIEVYYERAGAGAPALVFVHGGGGHCGHWQLQMPYFARLTTVLTCDLRGHGRSEVPGGRYSIETFVDDLSSLLDRLDIERPLVVGHSLGGTIALRYAFDFPDRVSGIVVVDSGYHSPVQRRDDWRQLVVARASDYQAAQAVMSRYHSSPHSGRAAFVAEVLAATPATPPQVINATHYGLLTFCSSAAASFLTCPVLVVGAADMDYWPGVQAWGEYVPHGRLVAVPRCGHYLMLEQSERFNAALEQFLGDVRTGVAPSGGPPETPPGWV
ncbi:MAG: alpha/beta fold hydrolase [Candidatus Latescibacteria bacterium]|nr:alpha/beta fold hydrolase [Candidatus Latescibacterota bacterium]